MNNSTITILRSSLKSSPHILEKRARANFLYIFICSSFFNYICTFPRDQENVSMKLAQSCPTLCNPMGYIVHGILQARILKQVAISFSRGSSQPKGRTQVSGIVGGFVTSLATRRPYAKFLSLFYLNYQILLQAKKKSHWVMSNSLCDELDRAVHRTQENNYLLDFL